MAVEVSIVGASGYVGGEILRILLSHPKVKIKQITSLEHVGKRADFVHPNLRKMTDLVFTSLEKLEKTDFLFVCLPNGVSMERMKNFLKKAEKIVDLGADFRLKSKEDWKKWYKRDHLCPELLGKFVYGLPEIFREKIKGANLVSGPGCEASCVILCLYPFLKNKIINPEKIIVEAKIGSSASGAKATLASHHPERKDVIRVYQATGHRHTIEIERILAEATGIESKILMTAVAVELVRGISVTCHSFLKENISEKEIWEILRKEYKNENFVRIVKLNSGIYRYPEPKILAGTNFFEIGFEKDPLSNRLVILGAIDNLGKGSAGNAVQCFNLMEGFAENLGLEFPGLHPL